MAEDLTSYTEVDPNSRITITSSRVTAASLTRNEDAYVYKSFGVGYFDLIQLNFSFLIGGLTDIDGWIGAGFSNNVNDISGWSEYLLIYLWASGSGVAVAQIFTEEADDTSSNLSLNTVYYATLARSGDAVSLYIYSNAARTSLVDTLTCSISSSRVFRYFYPMSSDNGGSTKIFSGYFENFEYTAKSIPVHMNLYRQRR